MSTRRNRATPGQRVFAASLRLVIDVLNVVLRAIAWTLEQVCERLEIASAFLRYEPVAQKTLKPATVIKTHEPTNVDKLALKLWAPSKGKPSAECYSMAEQILAAAPHA